LPLVGHSGDADNQIPSIPGPEGYPNVPNRGQLESSIRIREQLAKEGFPSEGEPNRMIAKGTPDLFLISANTGHGTSQAVRDQINTFLKAAVDKGGVSPAVDNAGARAELAQPRSPNHLHAPDAHLAKYDVGLFGDPGSKQPIAGVHGRPPGRWTKDTITVGTHSFPAANHIPALAYPN